MRQAIIPALIAAALLAAVVPAGASAPRAKDDGDKLVLENDHVKVWFQGKKPMLKVFPAGNESGGFGYKFDQVVEYRDLDGDGLPSEQEVLSRLSLASASAFEVNVTETEERAVLNLTLTAPVKLAGAKALDNLSLPSTPADRSATVRLSFTIWSQDAEVDANGTTIQVPATSIKYDFAVDRWPLLDAQNGRLALDMQLQGEAAAGEDGEADIEANGTRVGVMTWTSEAQGTTAAGENVTVPVKAKVAGGNGSRVVFTYDAANLATLVHDPTLGVAGDEGEGGVGGESGGGTSGARSEAPGPGVLLVAGAAGAVALAVRRKTMR
ncbi:MAG TPA: hypothetical protein VNX21_02585 [Candidatus Thermoplasmatota archaeon]|nr:hypothetical protein [Candidatus Thermoplasmatota archaeon]